MPVADSIIADFTPNARSRPAPRVRASARYGDIPALSPADAGLTAIERTTIALSRSDPIASVKPQGWFSESRLAVLLFGARRTFALANPRLEALRRYAILLRLDDPERAEARQHLRDAGYSARQIDEIDTCAAPPRSRHRAWKRLLA